MNAEVQTNNSTGITPLLTGIISDVQALLQQQLTLFESELKKDLRRTKDAAIPLAIGAIVCLLAGFFLCLALGYLLIWLWPELAYFAAFGIVGIALAIIGGGLVAWGKSQFDAFTPIPRESMKGLKENIQWTTKN
jgi:uncharacterized membrane protein YqjE